MKNNMSSIVSITAFIKDGGYQDLAIPISLLSQATLSIYTQGYEIIHLANDKSIEIVGYIMKGSQTGSRIIMLGDECTNELN